MSTLRCPPPLSLMILATPFLALATMSGCAGGIPSDDQDRIFQRFWRGDAERSAGEKRSGLGLTIVRQIVEAHGGEVKLVSALGHGSTFAIWLPALVGDPAAATGLSTAPPVGSTSGSPSGSVGGSDAPVGPVTADPPRPR